MHAADQLCLKTAPRILSILLQSINDYAEIFYNLRLFDQAHLFLVTGLKVTIIL